MKNIILLFFTLGFYFTVFAQQSNIIPVSPEAAALAKMVNYPVNYNTGVPDISIPLYQIETGGMKLPITLNYHAGGFKIHERATSVGLGWALSSDIQITRSINGLDDFGALGYVNNPKMKAFSTGCSNCYYPLITTVDAAYAGANAFEIAAGIADGMPDKFNYKLLNKSGSFYFRKNDAGTGYTIEPVPYDNIKITFVNGKFTIVDNDGTIYSFGTPTNASAQALAAEGIETSGYLNKSYTTFKCLTITNSTNTETIFFSYQAKSPITYKSRGESIEYYNSTRNNYNGFDFGYYWPLLNYRVFNTYEDLIASYPFYVLSSPKWRENFAFGKSQFHLPYLNDQNEVLEKVYQVNEETFNGQTVNGVALSRITFNGGSVIFTGADKLTSIRVQNDQQQEIKTFNLFQSYALPSDMAFAKLVNGNSFEGTPYLDSIQLKSNSLTYETYKMLYLNKFCFGAHLKGKDVWGHSNNFTSERNKGNLPLSIPRQYITQNYYRPNTYLSTNATFAIGSNPEAELTDESVLNRGMLKRVIYPTGGYVDFDFESNMSRQVITDHAATVVMSGGLRVKSISYFDGKSMLPTSQKSYRYGEKEDGIGKVLNSPARYYDINNYGFKAHSYNQKVVYFLGSSITNEIVETKTTYLPASSIDYTYASGAPISYSKVTEYNQDLGGMTGKKVYRYYEPDHFEIFPFFSNKLPGNTDVLLADGFTGIQKSIEDYKFQNNRYSLIHSKNFNYTKYKKNEIGVVYAHLETLFEGNTPFNPYNPSSEGNNLDYSQIGSLVGGGQYGMSVGRVLLSSETEKWVKETDTIFKSTNYEYGNLPFLQPSKVLTSSSNGLKLKVLRYAYNFTGNTLYNNMVQKNMLNVVEEVDSIGSYEIARSRTNFDNVNNDAFIAPVSVDKSTGGSALKRELTFDKYDDKANLLQITEKSKLVKSYIWGYNEKYPVAEIVGDTYDHASSHINIVALQGIRDASRIRDTIDVVRNALPEAMVTTYTYKPLVGLLTQTAPNKKNKLYEYDLFGRLLTIRNDSLQILSRYKYQYGGASSLSKYLFAVNTPQMSTFYGLDSNNVMRAKNVIANGGTAASFSMAEVNNEVENDLELNGNVRVLDLDQGDTASVKIKLKRFNQFAPNMKYPTKVYIDFLKNDAVVYTKIFPYSYTDVKELYIAPGNYFISIRFEENYNGSIYQVSIENSDNLEVTNINWAGQSVPFAPNTTHVIGLVPRAL